MPVKIKLWPFAACRPGGGDCFLFPAYAGARSIASSTVVAFLGLFMIFAMWLFPEVKRDESARAESAATTLPR